MNVYEEYLYQIIKPSLTDIIHKMDSLDRTAEWAKKDINYDFDRCKHQKQLDLIFFKAWKEVYRLNKINYLDYAKEKLESKFELDFDKDNLLYDFDIQIRGLILSFSEHIMKQYLETSRYLIETTSPRVLDLNRLRKGSFDIEPREVFDPRKLFKGTNSLLGKYEEKIYQGLRNRFIGILFSAYELGGVVSGSKTNVDEYMCTIWFQESINFYFDQLFQEVTNVNKIDYMDYAKSKIGEKEIGKWSNKEELTLALYTFEMDVKNLIITITEWAIEQYITGTRSLIMCKFDYMNN